MRLWSPGSISVSPRHTASLLACLSLLPAAGVAGCASKVPFMAVARPVVDLRTIPHTSATPNIHDPHEESQLLYGERVRLLEIQDGWAKVEAVEQAEYTHAQRWQGYPGWVPADRLTPWNLVWDPNIVITRKWTPVWRDAYKARSNPMRLPMGTMLRSTDMGGHLWKVELMDGSRAWIDHEHARFLEELEALPAQEQRQLVIQSAEQFLGDPYYWGGRSPHAGPASEQVDIVTGVDCSGLVNLSHRTIGLAIPRDAHEQFMRAHPVGSLRPGDLIFLSRRADPDRIVHVMLYAGDGQIIEGPGTGLAVRRIAVAERLGQPVDRLAHGAVIDEQTVYFGTFLE